MKKIIKRKSDRQTPSHIRSPKAEAERAKKIGGTGVAQSGGGRWEKGDVRKRGVLRLEHKTTKHQSFSVTRKMIRKIEDAALSGGEVPVIEVEFNKNGRKEISCFIVPEYVLQMIGLIE